MLQTFPIYPNRRDLEQRVLALSSESKRGPCISIYLSRQSIALSPAQRKFRMIKLVKEAERLVARDHGVHVARSLMAKLWRVDPLSLIDQSGLSLALFHEEDFTGAMYLPISVSERAVAAQTFHVKPVLQWLQSAPNYYLISLSSKRVRLYEGSPWELKLIHTIRSPWDLSKDRERSFGKEDRRRLSAPEKLRQFMLLAESEIFNIIGKNRHPVVLAGVSRLHPAFRSVNRDPDLVSHAIYGNVEKWAEEDLKRASADILAVLVEKAKRQAIREYDELSWRNLATDEIGTVAKSALRGEVRKLFIASDQTLWGQINPRTGEVVLHSEQLNSRDDDILDDLAEIVLAKGGKVLCMPQAELPGQSPLAAILSEKGLTSVPA